MSRSQAEVTERAIDRQVSMSMQEVLDKIDARIDVVEKQIDAIEKQIDAIEKHISIVEKHIGIVEKHISIVEKRLSWLYIESIVSICVMGAGFTGVIIALLRMG